MAGCPNYKKLLKVSFDCGSCWFQCVAGLCVADAAGWQGEGPDGGAGGGGGVPRQGEQQLVLVPLGADAAAGLDAVEAGAGLAGLQTDVQPHSLHYSCCLYYRTPLPCRAKFSSQRSACAAYLWCSGRKMVARTKARSHKLAFSCRRKPSNSRAW